jgi:hypothetical protein
VRSRHDEGSHYAPANRSGASNNPARTLIALH